MPSCVSLLFVGDFEQVYAQCVKHSVLALNIVDSPTLVFIPIVCGQLEQALTNLSSFDQSTIFSSLRKLFKPKISERHSRSFV